MAKMGSKTNVLHNKKKMEKLFSGSKLTLNSIFKK